MGMWMTAQRDERTKWCVRKKERERETSLFYVTSTAKHTETVLEKISEGECT